MPVGRHERAAYAIAVSAQRFADRRAIVPPEAQSLVIAPGQDATVAHYERAVDGISVSAEWLAVWCAVVPPHAQGVVRTPGQDAPVGHHERSQNMGLMTR